MSNSSKKKKKKRSLKQSNNREQQQQQQQEHRSSNIYSNSAWHYTFPEFRDLINSITDKSVTIKHALSTFREIQCLQKEYYYSDAEQRHKTIQDIAYKKTKITELFTALRNGMSPESPNLPFKKKHKEKQLISQLAKYKKGRIDYNNAHAIVELKQYSSGKHNINDKVFSYWVEAAIAPLTDLDSDDDAGYIEFIGSINGTPALDGGMRYFGEGIYRWINKAGGDMDAIGMRELLSKCGFAKGSKHFSQRRHASILSINLQTPCPDWQGSAGKMYINLYPYQTTIADVVSRLAYKIPSLHGKGIKSYDVGLGGIYKPFQRDFLRDRHRKVSMDKTLVTKDRLTQSSCWYRTRPKMKAEGFLPRKKTMDINGNITYDWNTTRTGFTNSIKQVIKKLWPDGSVTRESLGIVAKPRAFLYLNGQTYPVTFDSREELANKAVTDMVIVEKEGITDVLLIAAQKYRIALVATAGHFVDYVKDLMKLAYDAGRINVCVLTDYDLDGIKMWLNANKKLGINIKRIGITKDVVKWLREVKGCINKDTGRPLQVEDVEEEYKPNLKKFNKFDDRDKEIFAKNDIDIEYLKTKRIELDSIIEKVGPDMFWEYIVHKLKTQFPDPRDYREIVPEPTPEDYYPDEIKKFLDYIDNHIKHAYSDKWEEIKESELKEVKDTLLQVDDKKEEIDKVLGDIVQNKSDDIQTIIKKLKELKSSGELPEEHL
jgi:hypothetical protein